MTEVADLPLVLGGHSFISQLGNDPLASEEEQQSIVSACLDGGIRWIDTTYQPERVALGKALQALGRRREAKILAWNFFQRFEAGDPVGTEEPYRPEHIEIILEELRTDYVDCLVIEPTHDPELDLKQKELMIDWHKKGYVGCLGLWLSDPVSMGPCEPPFRFTFRAFNINTPEVPAIFKAYKALGWETVANSPFHRGWTLDSLIARASSRGHGSPESLRPVVADLMLRFALFEPSVDRLIVAMRKEVWIGRNLESVAKGPLGAEERLWLDGLTKPKKRGPLRRGARAMRRLLLRPLR